MLGMVRNGISPGRSCPGSTLNSSAPPLLLTAMNPASIGQAVRSRHARSFCCGVSLSVVPTSAVTLATIDANYASLAAITATGKNLDELRFG